MNKRTILIFLTFLCVVSQSACAESWPPRERAKVTVKIVNERHESIDGAHVRMATFYVAGGEERSDSFRAVSDEEGLSVFREKISPHVHFHIQKEGYYDTRRDVYQLFYHYGRAIESEDPLVLILRRIEEPIPMYGKGGVFSLPEEGEQIGFDLRIADWMPPHGEGRVADFYVSFSRSILGSFDFTSELIVDFPNKGDGFVIVDEYYPDSSFKTPKQAPQEGYESNLSIERARIDDEYQWDVQGVSDQLVFRTRTILGRDGSIETAHYSILPKGIDPIGQLSERVGLRFHYWFNPEPNNLNLEFDPGQNLLK